MPLGIDAALECVTLLGGIGFTWEHDAHLYWRRAISIASVSGTEEHWAGRLGEAALVADRDFSFVDEDATAASCRARVGAVLDEVLTLPADPVSETGWASARGGPRKTRLAGAGLVAPHYPAPYGLDAGPEEQAVVLQEYARRGLTPATTIIGEWVLPTILAHGTDEQQERFLAPTCAATSCGASCSASRAPAPTWPSLCHPRRSASDGGWSLNGQKVWTSNAQWPTGGSAWPAPTPTRRSTSGISYFLVDMRSPGVDVRPLRQITGDAEFNEVFLDDVFVPDDACSPGPDDGWKLATTTLANERLSMGNMLAYGGAQLVKRLISEQAHATSRDEAVRVLGRNTAREMSLGALNLRSVLSRLSGRQPGAEISVQKLYSAIAQRDGSRALLTLLGPIGALTAPSVDASADYARDHISLPSVLFGGGTIEIQLNVIAQRILGLPR